MCVELISFSDSSSRFKDITPNLEINSQERELKNFETDLPITAGKPVFTHWIYFFINKFVFAC